LKGAIYPKATSALDFENRLRETGGAPAKARLKGTIYPKATSALDFDKRLQETGGAPAKARQGDDNASARMYDDTGVSFVDSVRNTENLEDIKISVDRAKAKFGRDFGKFQRKRVRGEAELLELTEEEFAECGGVVGYAFRAASLMRGRQFAAARHYLDFAIAHGRRELVTGEETAEIMRARRLRAACHLAEYRYTESEMRFLAISFAKHMDEINLKRPSPRPCLGPANVTSKRYRSPNMALNPLCTVDLLRGRMPRINTNNWAFGISLTLVHC